MVGLGSYKIFKRPKLLRYIINISYIIYFILILNKLQAGLGPLRLEKSSLSSALNIAGFSKSGPTLPSGFRTKKEALALRAFTGRAGLGPLVKGPD